MNFLASPIVAQCCTVGQSGSRIHALNHYDMLLPHNVTQESKMNDVREMTLGAGKRGLFDRD